MGLLSLHLKPLGGDYVSESPRHGFKCPRSGGGMSLRLAKESEINLLSVNTRWTLMRVVELGDGSGSTMETISGMGRWICRQVGVIWIFIGDDFMARYGLVPDECMAARLV